MADISAKVGRAKDINSMLRDQPEGKECNIPLDLESYLRLMHQKKPYFVPGFIFETRPYNDISFVIYNTLLEAFHHCSSILSASRESKYLNLTAIFFHEILKILCGYYFKKYELDVIRSRFVGCRTYYQNNTFNGSVGILYSHVFDGKIDPTCWPWTTTSDGNSLTQQTIKDNLIKIRGLMAGVRGKSRCLYLTPLYSLNRWNLLRDLNTHANGFQWRLHLIKNISCCVPEFDKQCHALFKKIEEVPRRLARFLLKCDPLPKGIYQILDRGFDRYLRKRPSKMKNGVLLTGTLSNLVNRIPAAVAKSSGCQLVTVIHGDCFGALDEPIFGYGECTFADVIVGYGSEGGRIALCNNKYSRPLFDETPIVCPTASDKVAGLFTGCPIPTLAHLESPTFMYVPTIFSGPLRYGPFRDMHDIAYFEWQKGLLEVLAKKFSGRVIWKGHPKTEVESIPNIPGVEEIREGFFEDVLERADVFVFDYLSTAFSLAAATNKPIMYFDLGLRNHHPTALQAIKARCLFAKANPTNPVFWVYPDFSTANRGILQLPSGGRAPVREWALQVARRSTGALPPRGHLQLLKRPSGNMG